jgi:hypothetical protein
MLKSDSASAGDDLAYFVIQQVTESNYLSAEKAAGK